MFDLNQNENRQTEGRPQVDLITPANSSYMKSQDFQEDPSKSERLIIRSNGTAYVKPTKAEMDERIDFTLGMIGMHMSTSQICRQLEKKFGFGRATAKSYISRAQRRARKFIASPIEDHFAQSIQVLRNVICDPKTDAFARIAAQKEINGMLGLGRQYMKDEKEHETIPCMEIVVSTEDEVAEFNAIKSTMSITKKIEHETVEADEYGDDLFTEEVLDEAEEIEDLEEYAVEDIDPFTGKPYKS